MIGGFVALGIAALVLLGANKAMDENNDGCALFIFAAGFIVLFFAHALFT